MMMKQWSLEMDCGLVSYVNELCRSLAVASSRLHPHELMLTDVQLASQQYACLQSEWERH
jgi:E3 ubiquitin-protein ligase HECTD4